MALLEHNWDTSPMAGWREFRAALARQKDSMWVDTQLHHVLVDARRELANEGEGEATVTQLNDATD